MAQIKLGSLRDYWKNVSDWVKGEDVTSTPKVKDEAVRVELEGIKSELQTLKEHVVNTRSSESEVGYSTDVKPVNANKNDQFIELDTKDVYFFDGENWVMF